jgi:hypothetical protein
VPTTQFGTDHWSTFAYVETRAVDHKGLLDHDGMRCHAGRHPAMLHAKRRVSGTSADGSRYPTRIKASTTPDAHGRYGVTEGRRAADVQGGRLVAQLRSEQRRGPACLTIWPRCTRMRPVSSCSVACRAVAHAGTPGSSSRFDGPVLTSSGVLDVLDANGDIVQDHDVPTANAFASIKRKLRPRVESDAAAMSA